MKNIIKSYKEFYNSNGFKNVAVTIMGSIIAYFFYVLGYVFLYSYYFSGEIKENSIFQIFLDQVPFNFKLNVAIGVIILIIMVSMCIPLINIFLRRRELFISWVIFTVESIGYTIAIKHIIFSKSDTTIILNYFFVAAVVSFIPILLFSELYILDMFNRDVKKSLIIWTTSMVLCFLSIIKLKINLAVAMIMFIMVSAILNVIVNFVLKRKKIKEKEIYERKKESNVNYPELLVVFAVALIMFSMTIMIKFVSSIGDLAGSTVVDNSKMIIEYNDGSGSLKVVEGNIVTQNNDICYISMRENRKLLIIKSKNIVRVDEESRDLISNKD